MHTFKTAIPMFSLLAALTLFFSISSVVAAPTCGLVPPQAAPTNSTRPSSSTDAESDVVVTGWYASWVGKTLPPSQVPWQMYSALTFAFATTTPDVTKIALDSESATLLPTFVQEAKSHGVQALLSIGGWTGSQYFSTAVATAENRTAFVKTVLDLAKQYELDGIDFDWEYPGKGGIGCNTVSDSDADNFLSFLKELRANPDGSRLKLTAAVGLAPFSGAGGTPISDVSDFAKVLDYIAIMNYDVWGSFSASVGPNAPLDDSCAPTKGGSATSAVKAWKAAGFPASQIVLGVAAYGHSFHVDTSAAVDSNGTLALYPPFDKAQQPAGDSDVPGAEPSTDACGNTVGIGGTFNFKGMVAGGFLDATGAAADGIDYRFDNCSQTPFVYKPSTQTMISYDDKTSFAAKGTFINDNSLAGFAVWHVAGDSDNILLSAISDAMGIVQVCT